MSKFFIQQLHQDLLTKTLKIAEENISGFY